MERTKLNLNLDLRPRVNTPGVLNRPVAEIAEAEGAAKIARLSLMFGDNLDIGKAFDAVVSMQLEEKEKKNKEEIKRLGQEAVRVALENPDGIDAAIRSGDPKKIAALSTLNIDANRPEFIEQIKIEHGKNMALRDYLEFKAAMRGLDYIEGDPTKLKKEMVDSKVRGADKTFEYAYRATFEKLAADSIENWAEQQANHIINTQVENLSNVLKSKIVGGVPVSRDEIEQLIGKATAIVPNPQDKLRVRDKLIYDVFVYAHSSDRGDLLQALSQPDPKNNGLSLADIHKPLWDRAVNASLEAFRELKSVEAQKNLSNITTLMIEMPNKPTIQIDGKNVVVDSSYILNELQNHKNTYGYSSQWENAMNRVVAYIAKEAEEEATYSAFEKAIASAAASSAAPYISPKLMDEYGTKFVEKYTNKRLEEGANPAQITGELSNIAAKYGGLGKQYNDMLQHGMLSPDPQQVISSYTFLRAVEKSSPNLGITNNILKDDLARSKFNFLYTYAERYNGNIEQALQQFTEAAKVTGTTSWQNFVNKVLEPKDKEKYVKDVTKDLASELDAKPTFNIANIVEEEISRQLWLSAGISSSEKPKLVKDAVIKGIKERLEVGYDPISERPVAVLRQTPRVVSLQDGSITAVPPITRDVHKQAAIDFETTIKPLFNDIFGEKLVGLHPGVEASKGYGATVVVENSAGTQGELIFPYGKITSATKTETGVELAVPPKALPEGIKWEKDGLVIEKGAVVRLGSFVIAPHPTISGYASVYYVGETPKTVQEIEKERISSIRQAAEQSEKPSVTKQHISALANSWGAKLEKSRTSVSGTATLPGTGYQEEPGLPVEFRERKVFEPEATGKTIQESISDIKQQLQNLSKALEKPKEEAKGFFGTLLDTFRNKAGEITAKEIGKAVGSMAGAPVIGELTGTLVDQAIKSVTKWFAAPPKEAAPEPTEPVPQKTWSEKYLKWLHKSSVDGFIKGDTIKQSENLEPKSLDEYIRAVSFTLDRAGIRGDNNGNLIYQIQDFIKSEEGYSEVSYQDGKTRSIGYGFNLQRQDFRNILKNFGYDPEKIYSGKQSLSHAHAKTIFRYEISRLMEILRAKTQGVNIPGHAVVAIIDAAYNLGEGIINDLAPYLRVGDMRSAAKILLNKQPPSWLNERTKDVVRRRRMKEAYMLLGIQEI